MKISQLRVNNIEHPLGFLLCNCRTLYRRRNTANGMYRRRMEIVPFDAQAEFSVEGMESKTLQAGSYVFQVKMEQK